MPLRQNAAAEAQTLGFKDNVDPSFHKPPCRKRKINLQHMQKILLLINNNTVKYIERQGFYLLF